MLKTEEAKEEYRYLLRSLLWDFEKMDEKNRKDAAGLLFDSYTPDSAYYETNLYLVLRYMIGNLSEDLEFVLEYSRRYCLLKGRSQCRDLFYLLAELIQSSGFRRAPISEAKIELLRLAYALRPNDAIPEMEPVYMEMLETALLAVNQEESLAGKQFVREFFDQRENLSILTREFFPIVFESIRKYHRSKLPELRQRILLSNSPDKEELLQTMEDYFEEEKKQKEQRALKMEQSMKELREKLSRENSGSEEKKLLVFYGSENNAKFQFAYREILNRRGWKELYYQTTRALKDGEDSLLHVREKEFLNLLEEQKIITWFSFENRGDSVYYFVSKPALIETRDPHLYVYLRSRKAAEEYRSRCPKEIQLSVISLEAESSKTERGDQRLAFGDAEAMEKLLREME